MEHILNSTKQNKKKHSLWILLRIRSGLTNRKKRIYDIAEVTYELDFTIKGETMYFVMEENREQIFQQTKALSGI